MKPRLHPFAKALVELAGEIPENDLPALADAAIALLRARRLGRSLNTLPRLVRRLSDERASTLLVVARTPSGTLGKGRETLIVALERAAGKPVELAEHKDPALLGGAVLAVRDERFDLSLRRALTELSFHLTACP